MAPWTKEVYPKTVGPTEYCPPRHLGGNALVWRELMRWSNGAANVDGQVKDAFVEEEEEKVNSLDVLDDHHQGEVEEEEEEEEEGRDESNSPVARLDTEGSSISVIDEEEVKKLPSTKKKNPASPTGGWRSLTSAELNAVQKLGDTNQYGELTFSTYDLSHVALNTAATLGGGADGISSGGSTTIKTAQLGDETSIAQSPSGTTSGILTESGVLSPLRTVFSMDSTTSEDEKLNPKTPEEMANDTARLFRRSELSLKEKQEREDREEAEKREKERLIEIDKQERQRKEREESGDTDTPLSLDASTRKRQSRKFSGAKGILKTFSRTFSNINSSSSNIGASTSMRGRSGRDRSGSGYSGGRMSSSGSDQQQRPGMNRRSSTQALAIDRARDVADESDDEGSVVGNNDDDGSDVDVSVRVSVCVLF